LTHADIVGSQDRGGLDMYQVLDFVALLSAAMLVGS
jgi:hypothetical protein